MLRNYAIICLIVLLFIYPSYLFAKNNNPSFTEIYSTDKTNLNVVYFGDKDNPPILFIHGFSQSYLSWSEQYNSELKNNFYIIAYDLRGHGSSGKPFNPEAYQSPRLWADDVAIIIKKMKLKKPVLVGWSWAGFIIMNYVRYYGTESISGINLVGANTSLLGPISPPSPKPGQSTKWMQQLVSPNIEENLSGVKYFVDLMVYKKLSNKLRNNSIILNMLTPPYVRKAMLGYPKNNSDLIKKITVPVLISHGVEDMIVNYIDVVKVAKVLPNSTLSTYKEIGHAPFMEEPIRFNRELSSFTLRSRK